MRRFRDPAGYEKTLSEADIAILCYGAVGAGLGSRIRFTRPVIVRSATGTHRGVGGDYRPAIGLREKGL